MRKFVLGLQFCRAHEGEGGDVAVVAVICSERKEGMRGCFNLEENTRQLRLKKLRLRGRKLVVMVLLVNFGNLVTQC